MDFYPGKEGTHRTIVIIGTGNFTAVTARTASSLGPRTPLGVLISPTVPLSTSSCLQPKGITAREQSLIPPVLFLISTEILVALNHNLKMDDRFGSTDYHPLHMKCCAAVIVTTSAAQSHIGRLKLPTTRKFLP